MKKIATVVGLGVSGMGAARLLAKKGWQVRITEEKDTPEIRDRIKKLNREIKFEFELGRHTRGFVETAEVVVASPGVRDDAKPLAWARELKIPVVDEIEIGFRYCPAKLVAVTGTNGKSTTVTLIGEILKAGKKKAVVCGNIGFSFCEKVLGLKKDNIVVLETSSFQLQRIERFRPYVCVFLNITQNHLDRHKDFREYLNAKLNIFKNQKSSDWAVLNAEDKNLRYLSRRIKPRILYFGKSCGIDNAYFREGLWQKGEHNLKDAMAAVLVGNIFKIRAETIREALRNFKGLEHRCEYVTEIDGVKFINDSKATTVDAAAHAIRSMDGQVVLIAGGRDKGSDFTVLKEVVEKKVKAIVLIGEARHKIRTQLLGSVQMCDARDLEEAVQTSFSLADRGDCVLLSPMCASFDMFRNFEERGERFKKAVMALNSKHELAQIRHKSTRTKSVGIRVSREGEFVEIRD